MRIKPRRLDPNTVELLKHIGAGLLVLSVVAVVISGIWYGTRLPSLTITAVEARGGETIRASDVEQLVQDSLEGEYVGLVPYRFAWTYPESKVREKVETIDRIYNVQLRRAGATELRITYDEYVPFALWCASADPDSCIFLDRDGYGFAHAPKLSGGAFLRFVTLGKEVAVGEQVEEQNVFTDLNTLVQLLAERGWFVTTVEVDQMGDAYLQLSGGSVLKVATGVAPEELVDNFFVILASDDFAHLKPGNFQYIDLRFGNKVFVNEELAVPEEETASGTVSSSSLPNGEIDG